VKNSPKGWEFLYRWYTIAPTGGAFNPDNGDLQELLQAYLLNDFTSRPCFSRRNMKQYQTHFLPCVTTELTALKESEKWKDNHYYYVIPTRNTSAWVPLPSAPSFPEQPQVDREVALSTEDEGKRDYIKVVRGFMGFLKMFRFSEDADCSAHDLECHVIYGDFFGHGKELWKYIDRAFIQCDLKK
jgi:hypothetical protein